MVAALDITTECEARVDCAAAIQFSMLHNIWDRTGPGKICDDFWGIVLNEEIIYCMITN